MFDFDVLVVGTGPCGVHAAEVLAGHGLSIGIVDGGRRPPAFLTELPDRPYRDVRAHDPEQHRLFLGEDFSGIAFGAPERGVQVGGNRGYVLRDVDRWLPLEGHGGVVRQSLARGGLGSAWGAECAFLEADSLRAMGLDPEELAPFEEQVALAIGISGPPGRLPMQDEIRGDLHVELLMERGRARAGALARASMACERARVAALTRALGTREPLAYTDMESFLDARQSVWRPQHMLEELKSRVHHLPGLLASRVLPTQPGCALGCLEIGSSGGPPSGGGLVLRARRLVLALGAVGTARLLLHSLGLYRRTVPLLAKDRDYLVCLHPRTFGRIGAQQRTSLCQLVLISAAPAGGGLPPSHTQLYAYRSLQLFRLLGGLPLPLHASMRLLSLIAPSLVLADVRYPVLPDPGAMLRIHPSADGGQRAEVLLERPEQELRARAASRRRVRRALRHLGLWPLTLRRAAPGSASHYAGTVPMTAGTQTSLLCTDRLGALRQIPGVHVADASTFLCLPAAPPTFTMMANARRVAARVAAELREPG